MAKLIILNVLLLTTLFIISETIVTTNPSLLNDDRSLYRTTITTSSSSLPSKNQFTKLESNKNQLMYSLNDKFPRSTMSSILDPNNLGLFNNSPKNLMNQFGNVQWSSQNPVENLKQMETFFNQFNENMYKFIDYKLKECCANENCLMLNKEDKCNDKGIKNQNYDKEPTFSIQPIKIPFSGNPYTQIYYGNGNMNGNDFGGYEYNNMDSKSNNQPTNYKYAPPNGVPEDIANNIRKKVLEKSNYYRNKYGIESLTLDEKLNNYAQNWANQLVNMNGLKHRSEHVYGENLYASTSFDNLGEVAVDGWYNEIIHYDVNANENQLYDHLTQLLWRSSKKLGVGVSKGRNGFYNIVANYDPHGNIGRHFKENLPEMTQRQLNEELKKLKKSHKQAVPQSMWN